MSEDCHDSNVPTEPLDHICHSYNEYCGICEEFFRRRDLHWFDKLTKASPAPLGFTAADIEFLAGMRIKCEELP